jgi:hypothetical protein
MITFRIFEDGTRALLRRLRPLAMLFMFFYRRSKRLHVRSMQMQTEFDDDFGWLNQSSWSRAKATMTICQIEFGVLITHHCWLNRLGLRCTCIQYLNPDQ